MIIKDLDGKEITLEDYTDDIEVIEFLAIHPTLIDTDNITFASENNNAYTVTHIPTGRAIKVGHSMFSYELSKRDARYIANAIVTNVPELSQVSCLEDITQEIKDKVKALGIF